MSILAFLVYAASQKVVAFDPAGKLWQQAQQADFDLVFNQQVSALVGDTKAKVLHFSQVDCSCNSVAQQHIDSVYQLASAQGYSNIAVSAEQIQQIASYIPATPAIAVFDSLGKLVYLGPYSAGYACTVGNGIVESFISGRVQTPQATVLTNTEGCYCSL